MKTVLNIEGMSCQHCVKHVTDALSALNGVNNVSVSLEGKSATVEHDEGLTVGVLAAAVNDAGYDVL